MASRRPSPEVDPRGTTPRRILLVDDEPEVLQVLEECLTTAGYSVESLLSGDRALVLIEREPFDAVLLDIDMPGTSGAEALRRIRASGSSVPVIMVSGKVDPDFAGDMLALGAFDFISKPFNFALVRTIVAAACASRG